MMTTNPPSAYSPLVPQQLVFSPPGGAGASSGSASGFPPNPASPSAAPGGHQAPTGDPSSGIGSVSGIIPDNWKALVVLAEAQAGIAPADDVLTKVVTYFCDVLQVQNPQLCPGLRSSDLQQSASTWPTEVLVYTCIRRVVSWLDTKEHARVDALKASTYSMLEWQAQ